MTHWTQQHSIVVVMTMASVFAVVSHVHAQTPQSLPPTLRAAQHLQQQSGEAIDSLLQQSQQPVPRHQWGNGLRDSPTRQTAEPTNQIQSVRPAPYSQPANANVASDDTVTQSDEAWDQILRRSAAATETPRQSTKSRQSKAPQQSMDTGQLIDTVQLIDTGQLIDTVQAKSIGQSKQIPAVQASTEPSFLDRESAETSASESGTDTNKTAALVKRISINLMFVLAIAFGVLLLIRQWQKGRPATLSKTETERDTLNVSQVIPLANGASLHIVQGSDNKFVVAIDSGGIKSVNVLSASFEDTLTQFETREQRRQSQQPKPQLARHTAPQIASGPSKTTGPTIGHEAIDPNEDTTEIDEKLIQLLLQRAPAA